MSHRDEDRWLLPRRQTELPARPFVAEAKLHGRREATFLVLAMMFLVTTTALLVLGTSRPIDLGELLAVVRPDVELMTPLVAPFGALSTAVGVLAVLLACELYGRRRAFALLAVGLYGMIALVGFAYLADVIDGRDVNVAPALAMASYVVTGHVATLLLFDALGRRMAGRRIVLRTVLASLAGQQIGWGAFGLVLHQLGAADLHTAAALALGSCAVTLAGVAALIVPLAIAGHVLGIYLRVGRFDDELEHDINNVSRRLPAAMIVEEGDPSFVSPRRRAARGSIQPFSSAEMRFFTEGDQLAES